MELKTSRLLQPFWCGCSKQEKEKERDDLIGFSLVRVNKLLGLVPTFLLMYSRGSNSETVIAHRPLP